MQAQDHDTTADTTFTTPLQRFKLILAYNGTRYKGFQRQSSGNEPKASDASPNNNNNTTNTSNKRRRLNTTPLTIQECLEDALQAYSGLTRRELKVRFAGRTDGGVHARGQVIVLSLPAHLAAMDTTSEESVTPSKEETIENRCWRLRRGINSRLPSDISVENVQRLTNGTPQAELDPRKDTTWKEYSYTLKYRRKVYQVSSQDQKNQSLLPICSMGPNCVRSALDPDTLWVCPWPLDDSKLDEYCAQLAGHHDYSAFVHKRARREQSNLMRIEQFTCKVLATTEEDAPVRTVRFLLRAKSFRRAMIRNLIGFLVDLCRGKVPESIFETLWDGSDESASQVHSAPPYGLCLERVAYD